MLRDESGGGLCRPAEYGADRLVIAGVCRWCRGRSDVVFRLLRCWNTKLQNFGVSQKLTAFCDTPVPYAWCPGGR